MRIGPPEPLDGGDLAGVDSMEKDEGPVLKGPEMMSGS